ncbi:hypothetical protein HNQ37_001371 [Lactovum miscens]|uniref:Uncharacterized protein n=2 Tax=Lactovum miscens TaxID=190387 RepID=A0A841CA82_9LACT|nr:hypothetical protein [Lactovum miscens]
MPLSSIFSAFQPLMNSNSLDKGPKPSLVSSKKPTSSDIYADSLASMPTNTFGAQTSLSSISGIKKVGITLWDAVDGINSSVDGLTVSDTSFQEALDVIRAENTAHDYIIYIGGNLAMSDTSSTLLSSITSSMATSLTFVSDLTDNINSMSSVQDANASTISLPSSLTFNCPLVFRNINLAGSTTIYANGSPLAIRNGAYFTGNTVTIYGGSATSTVAQTALWFSATGSGSFAIYGGGLGTNVTGDTNVTVYNTSGNSNIVYGAGNGGSVGGSTSVNIIGATGGSLTTSGSSPNGAVTGNINLSLSGIFSTTRVSNVYGDANTTAPVLSTSRTVTVNVNCPQYTFVNNINATAYNLATTNGLLLSTVMNINAGSLPKISAASDGIDNFTNVTTTANSNTAVLNLGSATAKVDNPGNLMVTSLVHNFTVLNVLPNNNLDIASTGYILNGGSGVTGADGDKIYQSSYSNFGTLNIWQNSGITDSSLAGSSLNNGVLTPSEVMVQVGNWNFSPNSFIKTYMFSGNATYNSYGNPTAAPQSAFPILCSNITQSLYDQSGLLYDHESSLTWEPLAPVTLGMYIGGAQTGKFWGASDQYWQALILVIPYNNINVTTLSPSEIDGMDPINGFGFISDYEQQAIGNGNNGYLIFLESGGIREFEFNGSNISDGTGAWTLNGAPSGGEMPPAASYNSNGVMVNTSSVVAPTNGTMKAYASYFKNTINGITHYNLSKLIYPTSTWSDQTNINPATFNTINSDNTKTNFITYADVETPSILGSEPMIQWEWPRSNFSPILAPSAKSSDPEVYNTTNSNIISYAPGVKGNANSVPNSNQDFAYPLNYPIGASTSFNAYVETNSVPYNEYNGQYGFFPGPLFNGAYSIYHSSGVNVRNWTNYSTYVNLPSYLVYNTKTFFTDPNGGSATSPVFSSPTFTASDGEISVFQEKSIANVSTAKPYIYKGVSYTDPYQVLKAIMNPQALNYDGTTATVTPVSAVLKNGVNTVTLNYTTDAAFASSIGTNLNSLAYQTVGTTIQINYASSNGLTKTSTITIGNGSLSAQNVISVSQQVNKIASDIQSKVSVNAPAATISQPLVSLLGVVANDNNGANVTSSVIVTGWKDSTTSYSGTNLFSQIISDLSNANIVSGTKFEIEFTSPDGTTKVTNQLTIVEGSISASDIMLPMAQVDKLLATDTTPTSLGSNLISQTLDLGNANVSISGANVQAKVLNSSQQVTLTNAAEVYNWLNKIDHNSRTIQKTTLTFTTFQYGITITASLSVAPNAFLKLESVPNVNFGDWSSDPPDWSKISAQDPAPVLIYDSRNIVGPWQLTVEDDQTGDLASHQALIYLGVTKAVSSSGTALTDQGNSQGVSIMGNPVQVYSDFNPVGGTSSSGFETVSVTPQFYLSFPIAPNSSISGTDTLLWSLVMAPGN